MVRRLVIEAELVFEANGTEHAQGVVVKGFGGVEGGA